MYSIWRISARGLWSAAAAAATTTTIWISSARRVPTATAVRTRLLWSKYWVWWRCSSSTVSSRSIPGTTASGIWRSSFGRSSSIGMESCDSTRWSTILLQRKIGRNDLVEAPRNAINKGRRSKVVTKRFTCPLDLFYEGVFCMTSIHP